MEMIPAEITSKYSDERILYNRGIQQKTRLHVFPSLFRCFFREMLQVFVRYIDKIAIRVTSYANSFVK